MLAEARIKKRWTQEELGWKIKRLPTSIKKYEGGKVVPPFDVLYSLCEVLDLDIAEMTLVVRDSLSPFQYNMFLNQPILLFKDKLNNNSIIASSGVVDANGQISGFPIDYLRNNIIPDVVLGTVVHCVDRTPRKRTYSFISKYVNYPREKFAVEIADIETRLYAEFEKKLSEELFKYVNAIIEKDGVEPN